MPKLVIDHAVPLAPLTSFELGGNAQSFARIEDRDTLLEALRWAADRSLPVTVLGGGSNVVVSDRGVSGLVLQMAIGGVSFTAEHAGVVQLRASAGERWDELVAQSVARQLAGLECLSGIPGLLGATPIQNVGAYGQEVADTIVSVEVLDRATLGLRELTPAQCAFAYRSSAFKAQPEAHVVLGVTFALRAHGAPTLRYAELQSALAVGAQAPSLQTVRDTVLALRRNKSMVRGADDENRRSAGSFFTNPIVTAEQAQRVVHCALERKLVSDSAAVPRYLQPDGRVKLAAGWLIENAGVHKGMRRGHFGVSSRHALALVHHGGGKSEELVALAREVKARVHQAFGVTLSVEPVFLGWAEDPMTVSHAE